MPTVTRRTRRYLAHVDASPAPIPARSANPADSVKPRGDNDPPAPIVRARVRRSALVPFVLMVPCDIHDAPEGEPCFRYARGVCGKRVQRQAGQP